MSAMLWMNENKRYWQLVYLTLKRDSTVRRTSFYSLSIYFSRHYSKHFLLYSHKFIWFSSRLILKIFLRATFSKTFLRVASNEIPNFQPIFNFPRFLPFFYLLTGSPRIFLHHQKAEPTPTPNFNPFLLFWFGLGKLFLFFLHPYIF